ncbi:MAG: hypothetical protein WBC92_11835 [Terracidiphilus sp.]
MAIDALREFVDTWGRRSLSKGEDGQGTGTDTQSCTNAKGAQATGTA